MEQGAAPKTGKEMSEHLKKGNNPDGSKHSEAHPESGTYSTIKDLYGIDPNNPNPESNDKENDNKDSKPLEILTEKLNEIEIDEKQKNGITEKFKDKTSLTDEDLEALKEYSEDVQSAIKEVYQVQEDNRETEDNESDKDEKKPEDDFGKKLEEMEQSSLIEEVKKNQRFVSERDKKLKDYESQIEKYKAAAGGDGNATEEDLEAVNDMKALAKDFRGTYSKIKSKYNLPDLDVVSAQISKGDAVSRLRQYQENELRNQIERKHDLAEGEFEYDSDKAAKAGTPSYDWDYLSDKKLQEFESEQQSLSKQEEERMQKLEQQNEVDKKWFAEQFFDGDTEKVENVLGEMSETINKFANGEESIEKHPYALRNILKGFYADTLIKQQVEKVAQDLLNKFAEESMYLPSDKLPTDLSNVKTKTKDADTFNDKDLEFSPAARTMRDMLS